MKKFAAAVLALVLGAPAFAADTKVQRVDINTATPEQLRTTLGVSDEQARKIIEARPYAQKDDLRGKDVVDEKTFEKIQKLIESVC
jgi:DNA uptake protein ComE-like DNA-binding protein